MTESPRITARRPTLAVAIFGLVAAGMFVAGSAAPAASTVTTGSTVEPTSTETTGSTVQPTSTGTPSSATTAPDTTGSTVVTTGPETTGTETTGAETTGTETTEPESAEPTSDSGLEDQLQILSIHDDGNGRIELEVAVPESIGALAPVESNFAITDGDVRVSHEVRPVAVPTDVILVLDTSASMKGAPLAAATGAAIGFIGGLPDDTRIGLVGFGQTVSLQRAPDADRDAVIEAMRGTVARGETALWDALVVAADLAVENGGERPSIVVLSDADDTVSLASQEEAVDRLREVSAVLYAVAIETPDTRPTVLAEVVDEVGGQFLSAEVDRLDALYDDIALRLTNRYRLSFAPAASGRREIVVSVSAGDAVASARIMVTFDGAPPSTEADPPAGPGTESTAEQALAPPSVVVASRGLLANPLLLPVGAGAMFVAMLIGGLAMARPAAQIQLEAVSGADRLAGLHTRLGASLDQVVRRHSLGQRFDGALDAADLSIRPGEFMIGWAAVALPVGLGAAAMGRPLLGLLIAVALLAVTILVLRTLASRRRARFADQLTDTLGILAGSLRAGQSLPRAIELVAAETPAPTGSEFHRIAFEVRVGRDLTDSMRDVGVRMRSRDLEWLAQAVEINRELGGDLTEILDNVAGTIRERRTVARQVEALSAEGRATAWMLESMPIVLFLYSWWRTPEHTALLLEEPKGRLMLGLAVTGLVVGHLWIRQLVRPRF